MRNCKIPCALAVCLVLAVLPAVASAQQSSYFDAIVNPLFRSPVIVQQSHIKILNPVSKPTLWGRWETEFRTSGTGDLVINAYGATFFNKEIEFVQLTCNGKAIETQNDFSPKTDKPFVEGRDNGKIVVRNWSCDGKDAKLTLRILATGHHYLKFSFLGDTGYAENFADCTGTDVSPCHCCDTNSMWVQVTAPGGGGTQEYALTYQSQTPQACGTPPEVNRTYTYSQGYTFCPTEGQYTAIENASAAGGTGTCAAYSNDTSTSINLYSVTWDSDVNWCNCKVGATTCNGASCYNDTNPMGWESGTASKCCQDDGAEVYNFRDSYFGSPELFFDDLTTDDACCIGGDCVYGGNCYTASATADLNADGKTESYCYSGTKQWINTDYHTSYCTPAGYTWNASGGDATGDSYQGIWGASSPGYCRFQYDTFGGSFVASRYCCCGDDTGEYPRTCQNATGFPHSGSCTATQDACCDVSTDCVATNGNTCVNSGNTTYDGDANGDTDYCNAGTWYDCSTDANCPSGQYCSGNDCTACTAADCGTHANCRDGTAGCCDANSDCTAAGDDFCFTSAYVDENAKTSPTDDSDTQANNVQLAGQYVCSPAKYFNRGTEASTTDSINLNVSYSRTESYHPDTNWWQLYADGPVTAETSYTTSDTDLCFAYDYDPCVGNNATIYYENGAGTQGTLGTMNQSYNLITACASNWLWINFGSGTYGNTVGKNVLGASNGKMQVMMDSAGTVTDYVREWQFGWRKDEAGASDGSDSYWCCDASTDCVDDAPSQGTQVSGDPDTTDSGCYNTGSCHDTGSVASTNEYCSSGTWVDNDASQAACDACVAATRYNRGGDTAATTCCGDDASENYRYCQAAAGFPHGGSCTTSEDGCCDVATDCVATDGTTCVTSGSTAVDGDANGDTDYCNAGTWYDCSTDAQCPIESSCVANDCVDNTISGGMGTTCDASNKCMLITNSTGTVKARLDKFGYIDVKGTYNNAQAGTLSCSNCFPIKNSTNSIVMYIDNSGNLYTKGYFYKQTSPAPSGNNDFILKDSTSAVAGFIDGLNGSIFMKGQLHYSSTGW